MSSNKKLKIIHTEASPHWGGQEIRIFEEMKWFREQGHEMILVAPGNGTLFNRCKEEGFQVISVYFTKPRTLLNIFRMLWIIRRLKPNAVATHSSTDSWAGLIAAFLLSIKKRVRYRHVSTLVSKNWLNSLQYRVLSTLILTTGECIRKQLINNFNLRGAKIHVTPTPIQIGREIPSHLDSRINLQKKLKLSPNSRFIGQISVLRGWKGHLLLIEAFENISTKHPELNLVIVGEGAMREIIQEKISRSAQKSKIHLIGHYEYPEQILSAFDISVLASTKNEGIPQCLLLSMQCKVPIIANDVGGIPEIITEKTGVLTDETSSTDLSAKIFELYSNKNRQLYLANNAHKIVTEKFSWQIIGSKILKLYY